MSSWLWFDGYGGLDPSFTLLLEFYFILLQFNSIRQGCPKARGLVEETRPSQRQLEVDPRTVGLSGCPGVWLVICSVHVTKESVVMVVWLSFNEDGVDLGEVVLGNPLVDAEGACVVE